MGFKMRRLVAEREISLVGLPGILVFLGFRRQRAVIDELSYGHELRELNDAAIMVSVEMGDLQIIDAVDSGIVGSSNDAPCVAGLGRLTRLRARRAVCRPSSVD